MVTRRIKLITGVLIPTNRIAPVAASALGSLNALAPGRIEFGISTGFTGRRTMGLKRVKQADMKEYIRIVQGLLRGETVEWEFEGKRRKIRFLNPEIAPSISRTRFRSTSPRPARRRARSSRSWHRLDMPPGPAPDRPSKPWPT